jgi:hypothetical protein
MSVQKGAIGVVIRLTISEDGEVLPIAGATKKNIVLRSPSGVVKTKTGSFSTDGSDGKLEYVTTSANDLDEVGFWRAQPDLAISGYDGRVSVASFEVANNL